MSKQIIERFQLYLSRREAVGRLSAGFAALVVGIFGQTVVLKACHCCDLCLEGQVCEWNCGWEWSWPCCCDSSGCLPWRCYECFNSQTQWDDCGAAICSKATQTSTVPCTGSCNPLC
jgi:hypothetical protein